MNEYLSNIKEHILAADLVVIGLGEEWNISPNAKESAAYQRIIADLQEQPEYRWILPYVYRELTDDTLRNAYKNLFDMLEGKNYYVVATTVNRSFLSFVKNDRAVMPCGSDACMRDNMLSIWSEKIVETEDAGMVHSAENSMETENKEGTGADKNKCDYQAFINSLQAYISGEISLSQVSFARDEAGEVIPFNSVYADGYEEKGYLQDWSKYMSWLQGTMNRKTCLLELGAGLQFPGVFRFPFEKMTYYNRKAFCFRVHHALYQLTEEMAERSASVPVNAVELFADMEA